MKETNILTKLVESSILERAKQDKNMKVIRNKDGIVTGYFRTYGLKINKLPECEANITVM